MVLKLTVAQKTSCPEPLVAPCTWIVDVAPAFSVGHFQLAWCSGVRCAPGRNTLGLKWAGNCSVSTTSFRSDRVRLVILIWYSTFIPARTSPGVNRSRSSTLVDRSPVG